MTSPAKYGSTYITDILALLCIHIGGSSDALSILIYVQHKKERKEAEREHDEKRKTLRKKLHWQLSNEETVAEANERYSESKTMSVNINSKQKYVTLTQGV